MHVNRVGVVNIPPIATNLTHQVSLATPLVRDNQP